MINTGDTQLNGLIEELQAHIQLLAERAAVASGKLASVTAENTALKAKIESMSKDQGDAGAQK